MTLPSLHLKPLKALNLDAKGLGSKIKALRAITAHLDSLSSLDSIDLIADLRNQVRLGYHLNESFEGYTAVRRRESLLLSLYLIDLASDSDRNQLPAFDERVANSILGGSESSIKRHIRRLATQLYFVHYCEDRLPCLQWLSCRLQSSWKSEDAIQNSDPVSKSISAHADILFESQAPARVAEQWIQGESIEDLATRFSIPVDSLFNDRLTEEVILSRLRRASHTTIDTELDELVINSKERRLRSGHPLGAEAVKILIERSVNECQRRVPESWREQLVAYACDPRIPNASEQAKWWSWATQATKDVAIQALSELTLQQFIVLLERSLKGTPTAHQFPERKRVLLKLFELGKVIEARLVVHQALYHGMGARTREVLRPSRIRDGQDNPSFVCLRCTDEVFLIEGTHNFALRGFIGRDSFPIRSFWSTEPKNYYDHQLRVQKARCDIYQVHQGDWAWSLTYQLRRHHIEWRSI